MVVDADVKMATGILLVARGYEITASFIARAAISLPAAYANPSE